MIINAKLGVDAGNISIADLEFIEKNGGSFGETAKSMCRLIEMKPGIYNVKVSISDSWLGKIEEDKEFETASGKVVIGDVCYLFSSEEPSNKNWKSFLDKTAYLEDESFKELFTVSTGGDGEFKTKVSFKRI